jgi:hypothetical protein
MGLTTLSPSCADCHEIWEPQNPGTLRACNGIALPVLVKRKVIFEVVIVAERVKNLPLDGIF